ncbi:MAG TPA: TetR family transcriptional regulator [Fibrobacteres bacterium]|nr:TetR family transcriptional regulator [Fibrobacterota bacterium]
MTLKLKSVILLINDSFIDYRLEYMRKKEGTKEKAILNAAIEVFARDGYFEAKMHRIADIAGIGTGTVYLYYGNKENILLKIFENVWENLFIMIDQINKRTDISVIEKFNAMIDVVFDLFTSNPSLALVFVNEQNHLIKKNNKQFTSYFEKTLSMCETVFKSGEKSNVFNNFISPHIFSYFFFGGLRNLLHQWAENSDLFPLNKIRQNVKQLVLNGIIATQNTSNPVKIQD